MCHGFSPRDRSFDVEDENDDAESIESDPAFLNDEAAEDVELITDGGDEDD